MVNRLYIGKVGHGSLVVSTCEEPGKGDLAILSASDVGRVLRVLSEHRFEMEMESADGDFKLVRSSPESSYDYEGSVCGTKFGLTLSFGHVLMCALERAAFDLVKMRD